MRLPSVAVVVVNYNGAHYLPDCLNALQAQTYPEDLYEVIVSDNASTDRSLDLLRRDYRWVRVLESDRNLGFAGGNNVGILAAQGDYIVLLNNDTAPGPKWLENIVQVAEENPTAGLVTGHLRLFYEQLVLKLQAEAFAPRDDGRELGIQVFGADSGAPRGVVQYLDGFYSREIHPSGRMFRWSKRHATLGIPVPSGRDAWSLKLHIAAPRPDIRPVPVQLYLRDMLIGDWSVSTGGPFEYDLSLPKWTRRLAKPLVQNAGSIVFRNGAGRDRGTFVKDSELYYETDDGQYSEVEEVFAGCGASLLLGRDMLQDVGLLDEDFFMYYEDTDLSWRARLRGWKVLYAPAAIVRHVHSGTSEQWSPSFVYYTLRNRLGMVFKDGTWGQIFSVWGKFMGRVIISLGVALWAFLGRRADWRDHAGLVKVRLRVVQSLLNWLPGLWRKRSAVQGSRKVSPSELSAWFQE